MSGTLVLALLQAAAPTPVDSVIQAFDDHDVVAIGGRHSVVEGWN